MEAFKYLSEQEFQSLSNKERREYLKRKKEYDNSKLISDTLNFSETKEEVKPVSPEPIKAQEVFQENEEKDELYKPNNVSEKPATPNKDRTLSEKILLPVEKKQTKTHHKNFIMTEKRYKQFKALAEERGQSENALFNDLLTSLFGEE